MSERPPSRVFRVRPDRPSDAAEAIESASREVAAGGLLIMPTETVYGLVARPDLADATARLFEAKRRPRGMNLPVLASDTVAAWELGAPNPVAESLAGAFWPGPLTMVLPRSKRSAGWNLGEHLGSIALRVPDHALSAALLDRVGPVAATSANLSGQPPIADPERLVEVFGVHVSVFLVLEPGAPAPSGRPSTVVDLTGPDVTVGRWGAIGPGMLDRVLGKLGLSHSG